MHSSSLSDRKGHSRLHQAENGAGGYRAHWAQVEKADRKRRSRYLIRAFGTPARAVRWKCWSRRAAVPHPPRSVTRNRIMELFEISTDAFSNCLTIFILMGRKGGGVVES